MNKYWLSLYTDPIYNLKLSFATFSQLYSYLYMQEGRKRKGKRKAGRLAGGEKLLRERSRKLIWEGKERFRGLLTF